MVNKIFIKGNVASGKNSKVWTGKFLVHSKTASRYIKTSKKDWEDNKDNFLELIKNKEEPYKISFKFIRGSKHKFDYHNAVQLPLDLMQKHGWIRDDCADVVIPVFESYSYSKEHPGVFISIL